jgi:hypothetical protein
MKKLFHAATFAVCTIAMPAGAGAMINTEISMNDMVESSDSDACWVLDKDGEKELYATIDTTEFIYIEFLDTLSRINSNDFYQRFVQRARPCMPNEIEDVAPGASVSGGPQP